MSAVLLYFDEDSMDEKLLQALRSRAVDIVTAAEADMLHRNDDEQLNWAAMNNRVIYSFNARDFYRLHTFRMERAFSHAGIILAPQQRYGIGKQMRGILKLISERSAEDMKNQVEFLSDWVDY
ncbi:MAG: DUF5615 family PIN-like protein [Phormidesmis sp.]